MKGLSAVNGMAFASAYIINEIKLKIERRDNANVEKEQEKLQKAKLKCSKELENIMDSSKNILDTDSIEIFDFQLLLLEDVDFFGKMEQTVVKEKINCEYAVESIANDYKKYLEGLDNEYLRERSTDIEDLKKRLLYDILEIKEVNLEEEEEEFIIVATDITPTELIKINKNRLKGIVLEKGGLSSHCVILSRSMGIPFIINLKAATTSIKQGESVLMNAYTGEVTVSPEDEKQKEYLEYVRNNKSEKAELEEYKNKPTVTKDGKKMQVFANIISENVIEELTLQGGEGVGLYRTEMMYMEHKKAPDEESQFEVYCKIAKKLNGRPFVVRTLDAGGDKNISYLNIPKEDNPFLGFRAIRYCLANPKVFKEQIAAILRAGEFGDVRIMIPMITTISEIEQVIALVKETKEELRKREVVFADNIKIGMMMETPAAAESGDLFKKIVDVRIDAREIYSIVCYFLLSMNRSSRKKKALFVSDYGIFQRMELCKMIQNDFPQIEIVDACTKFQISLYARDSYEFIITTVSMQEETIRYVDLSHIIKSEYKIGISNFLADVYGIYE